MRIKFPNGSLIIFLGLDDEQKLLSINDIGTIFIEEAYECTLDIVEQCNLRMRGKNDNLQIILAWNPISLNHWLYNFTTNPPESSIYLHSTFKDNPFLPEDNRKAIEELESRNPQKWRIFGLGEWGVDADGLVLTNWSVEEFDETELAKTLQHRVGCDFGYNDPSAIVSSLYDKENKVIYVCNEFYKTGQTLDEVYDALVRMNLTKSKVVCDSAEPRSIDYLKRKGIHASACIKGLNSVDARITFLQNHRIIVHPKCLKVEMELSNFSYEKDRKTGKYTDGKYTHEFSHSIDALGYAYSDIYTRGNLRSLDKGVLGL